jgi:transposase
MLLKVAVDRQESEKLYFQNDPEGRQRMIAELKRRKKAVKADRIYLAYEASGLGFTLYDELTEAGIACFVLAPSRMERSVKQRRNKTDEKDAERVLKDLRGHVLAANALPAIWVPDSQTRDDRSLVRARLDVGHKRTGVKTQIRSLLKRHDVPRASRTPGGRTQAYRVWLQHLSDSEKALPWGARVALKSLLAQLAALDHERGRLDEAVRQMSAFPRYAEAVREMTRLPGVGILMAMVFLTEMGDLSRFPNREAIGAYLGLAPSANESGEHPDHKGHITRQGSARVRYMLCQITWVRKRLDPGTQERYDRIAAKNPKHKKIAVVAMMRQLAVVLWHIGLEAQRRAGVFAQGTAATAA